MLKWILRSSLKLVRWATRKVKASEYQAYKLPLPELIARTEARFIDNSGLGELPKCPYSGHVMALRHSKIVVGLGPVRDDMGFKCVWCYHTAHFGIPITRAEALEAIDLRGGPTLTRPSERPDEDGDEAVKERLRKLGYVE
ncbi:MAG: hypothetical protein ACYS76_04520 [Planctomycetota bacterium]|jgi:hypothetical protein